ncbi:toll/interleukin-1 receptor domain-containing protein [Ensifer adhaerens]|uniref:toll/interleukin-1 receptor domain-containing protein n=1 Tax=Ensifer adhaerens TaxID=106592 RepID=UPI00384D5F57
MSYVWDVFLSYPRSQQVLPWIERHFLPMFYGHLEGILPHKPQIFVDSAQPTGVQWPQHIQTALLRSRVMVAVWTPPYFRSAWCMAEWESMLEREAFLAREGIPHPDGLVYPLVFSDGKNFDPRAKKTQSRDLSKLNYHHECFRDSLKYLDFDDAVRTIAEEIEDRIIAAPEWNPHFPIVDPAGVSTQSSTIKLPRI